MLSIFTGALALYSTLIRRNYILRTLRCYGTYYYCLQITGAYYCCSLFSGGVQARAYLWEEEGEKKMKKERRLGWLLKYCTSTSLFENSRFNADFVPRECVENISTLYLKPSKHTSSTGFSKNHGYLDFQGHLDHLRAYYWLFYVAARSDP